MAAPPRQSTESQRPSSLSSAVQHENDVYNGYVEDDIYGIYGLEDVPVVDGFRPPSVAQNHDRISSTPPPAIDPANIPLPHSPQLSSTTKPANVDNFALRHDGRMGSLNHQSAAPPNESSEAPSLSRTTSVTSEGPILIPEGPYVGPTRPSHAYHMYTNSHRPQRSPSVATATSFNMPLERTYSGPSGPAHPYALYPQNTVPEVEDDRPVNANIPIGFNDLAGQQYQRRLGPDGEDEADLIGPHGHTEELPPYTKYPDEAYARKMRQNAAPSIRSNRSSQRRESVAAGVGGIGLATRNPEFSSNEDLVHRASSTQPSRESTTLSTVSTHSAAPVTAPKSELSEKPPESRDSRWKQRANKRACGIVPVWALCLAISVIICVGLLLGVTLGIVLTNKAEDKARSQEIDTSMDQSNESGNGGYASGFPETGYYISTVTTTIDASPLPSVPTDLPDLPIGNYSLLIPPSLPTRSGCLARSDHLSSWSCSMPAISLQLTILNLGNWAPKTHNKAAYFTAPKDSLNSWSYGTQPPKLDSVKPMNIVDDLDDVEYGPAWFFQFPYDKVVVLQESTFSTDLTTIDAIADLTPETPMTTTKTSKRDEKLDKTTDTRIDPIKRDVDRKRKGIAYPGDKPWFCYWKGTLLEVFIYPNVTSDAEDARVAASQKAAWTAEATATNSLGDHPVIPRNHRGKDSSVPEAPSVTTVPTSVAAPSPGQTTNAAEEPAAAPTGWPEFPRVVKIEERRMPRMAGFDQPYCKQMKIMEDGYKVEEVINADGHGRSIILSEKLIKQAKAKRNLQPWNAQGVEGLEDIERDLKQKRSLVEGDRRVRERIRGKAENLPGSVAWKRGKRDLAEECHCIWMVDASSKVGRLA